MKILSPDKIQEVDRLTIEREPITSIDLMERASKAFVRQFLSDYPKAKLVHLFCGPGNNGGDGLAIGRLMNEHGLEVHIYILQFSSKFSADHLVNNRRLMNTSVQLHRIEQESDLPSSDIQGIIIDAIFGSGLNKVISGLPATVVEFINQLSNSIVAVDIPSGVFAELPVAESAVQANLTYSFQIPKLAFFLPDNEKYIGEWKMVDIGLTSSAIEEMETDHYYTDHARINTIFQNRNKFSHKGSFGHAMIMAGSKGKAGAAILAGRAALKSGLGLLTMHIPSSLLEIMQESVPEAMCSIDESEDILAKCPDTKSYSALGIGPGIGQDNFTVEFMAALFQTFRKPIVIDADGLNILSSDIKLLSSLPHLCILTPHPGEFKRLVGPWANDYEKIVLQKDFSKKYQVIVVLKGAHTCISDPSGKLYFNSTGNNGMATAGSGDALTGLITGLLAQGYSSLDAAILGVYLHGLAGDLALESEHENSLIASDIINYVGHAFKEIERSQLKT